MTENQQADGYGAQVIADTGNAGKKSVRLDVAIAPSQQLLSRKQFGALLSRKMIGARNGGSHGAGVC